MNIRGISILLGGLMISMNLVAQSNFGKMYWNSIKCGSVTADLMINHRTVSQPTLFINSSPIKLEEGPNYSGPLCVRYRGELKVGYVESMGNAYEAYYLVDIDTFKKQEITRQQAVKIGFK
jgi:hypothetical protein